MCGICGTAGSTIAKERLKLAMQRIAHRGPDQQGSFIRNNIALGHQRLAIIDLTQDGQQPMTNEDRTIWLVFNGEIYNFAELRAILEPHHQFRSLTDSEVLIHGYEHWGIEGLLDRIQGMFAFAIWDEVKETLHIVRDRLGKKPLYYSTLGGGLSFASTLPALLELLETTPEVSRTAVLDYLTYYCVPSPGSMFEGVFKLPPAHRLEFRLNQSLQLIPYWTPDFSQKDSLSEPEWLEQIEIALQQSVRDRLIADVPLGAFLSGGVDSSLVVALMAKVAQHPVTTISMGFAEQQFNELPYARQVAEACGTIHHEYILRPDAAEVLPNLIFHYGEPFADHSALATYYLARVARNHVTVVLTGDGGDENFAGYSTAQATRIAQMLHRLPEALKYHVANQLHRLEQQGLRSVRKFRWIAEISRGQQGNYVFDPVGSHTFRLYKEGLFGAELSQLAIQRDWDSLYRSLWTQAPALDWVDRALYVDMMALLPNDFLVKVDVATMAHGLEARSPFLDERVIQLACKIPSRLKLKHWRTKYLLKRLAEKYLPAEVLYRRKQGFSVPISRWLQDDLSTTLRSVLLSKAARERGYFCPKAISQLITHHEQGTADHGQRLWMLLILELWFQMFIDKTLSPSDVLSTGSTSPQQVSEVLL